jgi:hypothetical protein
MGYRRLMSLVAVTVVAACGAPTQPLQAPSESYVLETVNQAPLPFLVLASENGSIEIARREIHLDGYSGFLDIVTLIVTDGETSSRVETRRAGIVQQTGAALTLHYEAKPPARGRLRDGVLELMDGGMVFELRR